MKQIIVALVISNIAIGCIFYDLGRSIATRQDKSICTDSLEYQEQQEVSDCKREVDTTIQACLDLMQEECGPKLSFPPSRVSPKTDL